MRRHGRGGDHRPDEGARTEPYNAGSIAGLVIDSESLVAVKPEEEKKMRGGMPGGMGGGDMY